jgi:hypothetical protein
VPDPTPRRRESGGRRQDRTRDGSKGRSSGKGGARRDQSDASRTHRGAGRRDTQGSDGDRQRGRRRDLHGAAANLPNWVVEALARVTPDRRVGAALQALGEASEAFAEGAYHRAVRKALQAKELAPRDTTVRETLGLAAYRTGDWQTALAELRTFRRLAGETTHLPVEMDSLRALGRDRDVETAWQTLQDRGGKPATLKEAAVVYGSYLIDKGRLDEAWDTVAPRRLRHEPFPEDLRLWYVAARVAALRGDAATAVKLRNDILEHDPGFPGIDELEKLIAAI